MSLGNLLSLGGFLFLSLPSRAEQPRDLYSEIRKTANASVSFSSMPLEIEYVKESQCLKYSERGCDKSKYVMVSKDNGINDKSPLVATFSTANGQISSITCWVKFRDSHNDRQVGIADILQFVNFPRDYKNPDKYHQANDNSSDPSYEYSTLSATIVGYPKKNFANPAIKKDNSFSSSSQLVELCDSPDAGNTDEPICFGKFHTSHLNFSARVAKEIDLSVYCVTQLPISQFTAEDAMITKDKVEKAFKGQLKFNF